MAAAEHGHGLDQRARRGLLQQVDEDDHQRALGALGAAERRLVVAVERARLQVEQRAHDRLAARAARLERGPDLLVEGDRAGAVAELVGDERERGGGVQAGVEDVRAGRAERRGAQ